jgi:hypothetical protein
VCFAWIFFRASSFPDAISLLQGLRVWDWKAEYWTAAALLMMFSVPMLLMDLVNEKRGEEYLFEHAQLPVRYGAAAAAVVVLLLFTGNMATAFIYFRF